MKRRAPEPKRTAVPNPAPDHPPCPMCPRPPYGRKAAWLGQEAGITRVTGCGRCVQNWVVGNYRGRR